MGEQYGLPDLRQMMAGRAHFPGVSHVGEPFLGHQSLTQAQHYEMGMVGEMLLPPPPQTQQRNVEFRSDSSSVSGFEESGGVGGNGRWPRQETLTLLEIRSRLDHKFKEANHKGPLWDEVSRIMAEEHGYQRSGKKCREKLENLYKYYKKTKEGKAGRQDGKHYRFFRQLEALYGENSNPAIETNVVDKNQCQQISNPSTSQANQEPLHAQKFCESLSLSNSSEFNTSSSSSDDEDLSGIAIKEGDVINMKKDTNGLKRGRKSWRSKVREFIDLQMKKFMDIQETWLEKMLKTLEHQEKERVAREEAWRKQESERFDREHKFWESERAWIEARDAALVEALKKFSGREFKAPLSPEELHTTTDTDRDGENECEKFQSTINNRRWLESEILCLIKLRSAMESSFQEFGGSKLAMWDEISAKMGGMGYERSAKRCKEKWEYINKYLKKTEDCNKKRKENSITCPYVHHLDSLYSQRGGICGQEPNDQAHETMGHRSSDGLSPSNPNVGLAANDSCLRFLMADGDNLWENYGIKLSTGGNQ